MANVELTKSQSEDLRAAQQAVEALYRELDKLEAAHVDVTDLRLRLDQANRVRNGLLQHFSPAAVARSRR